MGVRNTLQNGRPDKKRLCTSKKQKRWMPTKHEKRGREGFETPNITACQQCCRQEDCTSRFSYEDADGQFSITSPLLPKNTDQYTHTHREPVR